MKKVLLINPPAKNLVKTFAPDSVTEEMGFYPPLGLLYVASSAKKVLGDRIRIEVLDTQVERMDYPDIENYFQQNRPDILGISCMTFLLIDALNVARIAKRANPEVKIVFGGTHPSIYPKEMASQPEVDAVVFGEGERTFTELLDALLSHNDLEGIKGVAFRRGEDVLVNPPREFIKDLDNLPFPDRGLLPEEKYYNLLGRGKELMTSLLTSRGCPYNCLFCTKKDGRLCRMRSPENVMKEIKECVNRGITDFDIIDDTFTINKKRAGAIADLIIQNDLNITMDLRARVDTVDQSLLDKLAQAGCTRIRFGVESGNPEVLKTLKKGITLDQVRQAFAMAKNAGIVTFAYFMLGSPGETEADIKQSLRLAKEIAPDYVQFLITTPFPATELYRLGLEKGVLKSDYWREFSADPHGDFQAEWWTENFSHEELEKWQKKVHLSFYYRPGYVFNQITSLKSWNEFKRKAKTAWRMLMERP
jgi:anaerobic magnesium-protoporphyrin IX monomethyl ester cyclase